MLECERESCEWFWESNLYRLKVQINSVPKSLRTCYYNIHVVRQVRKGAGKLPIKIYTVRFRMMSRVDESIDLYVCTQTSSSDYEIFQAQTWYTVVLVHLDDHLEPARSDDQSDFSDLKCWVLNLSEKQLRASNLVFCRITRRKKRRGRRVATSELAGVILRPDQVMRHIESGPRVK